MHLPTLFCAFPRTQAGRRPRSAGKQWSSWMRHPKSLNPKTQAPLAPPSKEFRVLTAVGKETLDETFGIWGLAFRFQSPGQGLRALAFCSSV